MQLGLTLLTFAWAPWLVGIVTVLFLLICVMMILTVLIQRPQGGGLSGAFGSGAGSGQTAFGAKTGDALTIFTIIVFVFFLLTAISLNYGYRPSAANVVPAGGTSQGGSEKAPADTGGTGQPAPATGTGAPAATPPVDDKAKSETPPPAPTPPADKPADQPAEKPAEQPK